MLQSRVHVHTDSKHVIVESDFSVSHRFEEVWIEGGEHARFTLDLRCGILNPSNRSQDIFISVESHRIQLVTGCCDRENLKPLAYSS
jgi:hypothetical protein